MIVDLRQASKGIVKYHYTAAEKEAAQQEQMDRLYQEFIEEMKRERPNAPNRNARPVGHGLERLGR